MVSIKKKMIKGKTYYYLEHSMRKGKKHNDSQTKRVNEPRNHPSIIN